MSKAEMLIEYTTQDIISWIMEDEHLELEESLALFYSSATFEKLTDIATGLYLDSPSSIYQLFRDEQAIGAFVQNEI